MGSWQFYRVNFASTGSTTQGLGLTPASSWKWDNEEWARRNRADAPIDVTDKSGRIFLQVDTASTDLQGQNAATSADVNFLACAVPAASTGVFGGRFDSSSLGYFYMLNAIGDNLRKSVNVSSTFSDTVPAFRVRYDRNTSNAGYCTVFISFKTDNG